MAVRFEPAREEAMTASREARENLAEVIDLRSRLLSREPAEGAAEGTVSADPAPANPARGLAGGAAEGVARIPSSQRLAGGAVGGAVWSEDEPDAEQALRSAMTDAVRLLARRAVSSGELRRGLLECEHDRDSVEAAIDECGRSHYFDDDDLARSLVESLRERKSLSRAQLRQHLRKRLLPDSAIEEAIASIGDAEESEALREVAMERARRLSGLDHEIALRRLLGYLARRGWSGERAIRAARNALEEQGGHPASTVRFS